MNKFRWLVLRNNLSGLAVLGVLVCCLGITGCATSRLYSVNMNYDAEKANIPAYLKADNKGSNAAITIAEFVDIRKGEDQTVIGRVVEKTA